MKRLAWFATIALTTVTVIVALWHFRLAVQLFLISLAVAAAFRPLMSNLTRYGLPLQAVVMEFTSGAAAALDEYSSFLTGGQMDEVFSQIEGNFVGLGIEMNRDYLEDRLPAVVRQRPHWATKNLELDALSAAAGVRNAYRSAQRWQLPAPSCRGLHAIRWQTLT